MQYVRRNYCRAAGGAARVAAGCLLLVGGILPSGCTPPPQPARPVPEVAVATLQASEVLLSTELPGRTSPYRIAEIRPQVGGIIEKRLFQEGSDVKAGDVLYQIVRAPFDAAFDNAKASLARSEASLPAIRARAERYKDLLADNAVSRQEHDDAAAALKQAEADVEYWKAALESTRINREYTAVTAPISGRIGRSTVTDGALVSAHQPQALATIQQLNPIYVDVPQSTVELLRLKERLTNGLLSREGIKPEEVTLVLEDGTPYGAPGTLQFQDITVNATTGSVILRITVPNPDGVLLPGMFIRARVKEGMNKAAILVPQQSVSRDPKGNPFALIIGADGKVAKATIRLDREIGDKWLVSSGLAVGDRVIAEGMQKIKPGDAVTVVPFKAPKAN